MNGLDRNRWDELSRASGVSGKTGYWYEQLVQLYTEPHRHYHKVEHIVDCLNEFERVRHLAREPQAV